MSDRSGQRLCSKNTSNEAVLSRGRSPNADRRKPATNFAAARYCKQLNNIFVEDYRSGHNEAVLKTVWVQAHGGSNPSSSAKTE